jgi:hypothetical protein
MPAIKKIITSFIMLSAEVIFQVKLTLSANDDKKMQIPGGGVGGYNSSKRMYHWQSERLVKPEK